MPLLASEVGITTQNKLCAEISGQIVKAAGGCAVMIHQNYTNNISMWSLWKFLYLPQ